MQFIVVILALLLGLLSACSRQGGSPSTGTAAATADSARAKAEAEEAERVAQVADCKSSIEAKLASYRRLMSAKEYWPATLEIRQCSELLADQKLTALVAEAEVLSYRQDLNNLSMTVLDRLRSAEALQRHYPEQARRHEKQIASLAAEAERQRVENDRRRRLNSTPPIGSTMRDVIENHWGHPMGINKTTTVRGTTEQWVYENRRYLYFDNGILTAIQE